MDGRMDGWMEGWMDGRMGGWVQTWSSPYLVSRSERVKCLRKRGGGLGRLSWRPSTFDRLANNGSVAKAKLSLHYFIIIIIHIIIIVHIIITIIVIII